MTRRPVRVVYIVVAVVLCPLLAWNLAVGATNRGFGSRGFVVVLLAVPVLGAVLGAAALRRRPREATLGAVGAVMATFALVVALIYIYLSSR